jgi:hypothetical protein
MTWRWSGRWSGATVTGAAWTVIEFINAPLLDNPHRVGGTLRGPWEGHLSAHVGELLDGLAEGSIVDAQEVVHVDKRPAEPRGPRTLPPSTPTPAAPDDHDCSSVDP